MLLYACNQCSGHNHTGAEISMNTTLARNLHYGKWGQPLVTTNCSIIDLTQKNTHWHSPSQMSISLLAGQTFFEHTCHWLIFRRANSSTTTHVSVSLITSAHATPYLHIATNSQTKNKFSILLASHPNFTASTFSKPTAHHNVTHCIPTTNPSPSPCTAAHVVYHQTRLGCKGLVW